MNDLRIQSSVNAISHLFRHNSRMCVHFYGERKDPAKVLPLHQILCQIIISVYIRWNTTSCISIWFCDFKPCLTSFLIGKIKIRSREGEGRASFENDHQQKNLILHTSIWHLFACMHTNYMNERIHSFSVMFLISCSENSSSAASNSIAYFFIFCRSKEDKVESRIFEEIESCTAKINSFQQVNITVSILIRCHIDCLTISVYI